MLQVDMSASVRTVTGKGPMRQLRMQGITPAVVYGSGKEAQNLQMETKSLMAKLLKYYRRNTIVTLKIDDSVEKSVVIGEVQTDPVKDTLIHVDFCEIDLEKNRQFDVPVKYKGPAKGVELGGNLVIGKETVVLEGKPLDIPDEIVVDIKNVDIGGKIKCKALAVPESVKMITPGKETAVSVVKAGVKIVEEDDEDEE